MRSFLTWSVLTIVVIGHSACRAAQALLTPSDDAPAYQLSNIRIEADRFGMAELAIDYRRTRKGAGHIQVAGKTDRGQLHIMGFPMSSDDSGTIRLREVMRFGRDRGTDVEIYLTTSASWAGEHFGNCMVSNAVRLGNPGPVTQARAWNDVEKAAFKKHLRGKQPPETVPEGQELVTSSSQLMPGMPVQAGRYGEWENAEVISVSNGEVHFKFHDQETLTTRPAEKWFVVEPAVLQRAQNDPSQFRASVEVLPGGRLPIPKGALPLDPELDLLVGTPLQLDYGSQWRKVYVLNADREEVKVRFDGSSATWDKVYPRTKFVIDRPILKKLNDPQAVNEFAANVRTRTKGSAAAFPTDIEVPGGVAKPAPKRRKSYPVKIAIPRGAQRVPEALSIERGTPLASCWARKWNPVTALSENDDGSINVRWDDYGEAWDCSIIRQELIIEDKTVQKLQRKNVQAERSLKKTSHTWTDASGQHQVEAKLVSRTETKVTLKTKDGREIIMPIAKLSDEDRRLLNAVPVAVENPFGASD